MLIPGIDPNTKNIVSELYWQIGMIGEDFENRIRFIRGESSGVHDPILHDSTSLSLPSDPIEYYKTHAASLI